MQALGHRILAGGDENTGGETVSSFLSPPIMLGRITVVGVPQFVSEGAQRFPVTHSKPEADYAPVGELCSFGAAFMGSS